jgi:hypothetical protein
VVRHILLLPILLYLSLSFAGTNDSYPNKELSITTGYDKGDKIEARFRLK